MKWSIITHNIRGVNDPENIAKEKNFLNSLTPKVDIVMLQEHKLMEKNIRKFRLSTYARMRKLRIRCGTGRTKLVKS